MAVRKKESGVARLDLEDVECIPEKPSVKILSRERQIITKETAQEYLKLPVYEGQRGVKRKRISWLVDLIKKGKFFHSDIHFAKQPHAEQMILMDGQHRLQAVVNVNIPDDYHVEADIVIWHTETADDLKWLFTYFNNSNSGRTAAETTDAVKVGTVVGGVNRGILTKCRMAIFDKFLGLAVEQSSHLIDNIQYMCDEYAPHLLFVEEMMGGSTSRFLKRKPIIAAMIHTFHISEEDAYRFWEPISKGAVPPNTTLHTFFNYIIQDKIEDADRRTSEKIVATKCIHAWNAFRKGTTLKHLKYYKSTSNKLPTAL